MKKSYLSMAALAAFLAANASPFVLMRAEAPTADELATRMEAYVAQAQSIQDKADSAGRQLTADESHDIHQILAKFNTTKAAYEVAELREKRPAAGATGAGRKTTFNGPGDAPGAVRATMPTGAVTGDVVRSRMHLAPGPTGRRVADLFGRHLPTTGSNMSAQQFFAAVGAGHFDHRLVRAEQSEGVGEDGGFIVPVQLISAVLDGSLESELIRPRATVFGMASNTIMVPKANTTDRTSSISGVRSQWISEGETADIQTAQLSTMGIRTKKLMSLLKLSNELVYDAMSGAEIFADIMRSALGFDLDRAFIRGTGAGMPLGILNAGSLITVPAESGQAADTVIYENIIKMWSRLAPACQKRAVWIISSEVWPQVISMRVDANSTVPILAHTTNLAGEIVPSIFGREVLVTEHASRLGDVGDIILADLSQYYIGLRLDATLDRSSQALFASDQTLWRLITRLDGQPSWSTAITPANSGPTLSWATTLAAR